MRARLLAAVAACGVVAATVWWQWPAAPEDQVHAYTILQDFDYSLLEGDARGLATAKGRQGFDFHTGGGGVAAFQVRCKGVVVMDVQNAPPLVLIRMPADALWRAPDIAQLHRRFQRWLGIAPGDVVGAGEPSWVQARILRMQRGVPDDARCVFGVDVGASGSEPFSAKRALTPAGEGGQAAADQAV